MRLLIIVFHSHNFEYCLIFAKTSDRCLELLVSFLFPLSIFKAKYESRSQSTRVAVRRIYLPSGEKKPLSQFKVRTYLVDASRRSIIAKVINVGGT